MKTIMTSLPIYDKIEKQYFERGKKGGVDKPVPIICPRYRLPSFQWLDDGDGATSVTKIELIEQDLTTTDITAYFTSLPLSHAITGDKYFSYEGDILNTLLPTGVYYLKITMDNSNIYYSDWFRPECIDSIVASWTNHPSDPFSTLTTSGVNVTSAIALAFSDFYSTESFDLKKGETVTFRANLTLNSGATPYVKLRKPGDADYSASVNLSAGINEITLTSTASISGVKIYIEVIAASNFSLSNVYINKQYSTNYLKIDFSNSCDLGDLLYHDGFTQTIWFESEPMEMTFPIDDKGVEDGEGRFIRTFARQVKKYTVKIKEMPAFMVDVFHRMRLHDDVELTDLVGDTNEVYNLEVEHEWLWDDKYYAQITLTFDYNEVFVVAGCCNNLT